MADHILGRKVRRKGKGTAKRDFLLALVLVALFACSLVSADAGVSIDGKSNEKAHETVVEPSELTSQQAYERAIQLLRGTLVNQKNTSSRKDDGRSHAHKQPKKSSASVADKKGSHQKQKLSGLPLYWELFRNWLPFTGIFRDLIRLRDMLMRFFVDNTAAPGQSGASSAGGQQRLSSALRSNNMVWEGAGIYAPAEGYAAGTDPAEQEQARMYAGARPEQLWPEWDGGDDAYFGPFYASTHDEVYVEEVAPILTKVGFGAGGAPREASPSSRPWNKLAIPGTQQRKLKALQKREQADNQREEAVALLTWAAGWGPMVDRIEGDRKPLVTSVADIDWSVEAERGSDSTSMDEKDTEDYIEAFFSNSTRSADVRPNADALWTLAIHSLWGTHGAAPLPTRAKACLKKLVELNGNASAHTVLGWIEGGAWDKEGWALLDVQDTPKQTADRQAKALMHYTSAAKAGDSLAQMTLAYRYSAGIGVPTSCGASMYWYEKAVKDAMIRFRSGPPGGLTLPYTHLRLSDISGGVFGPGSSAASTGLAKHRPAIQAMLRSLPADGSSNGRRMEDLLEFFTYHAHRGEPLYALNLARIYYGGSVLGSSESAARVGRDYRKAREYLLRITRDVWPVDAANVARGGPSGSTAIKGERGDDVKLKADDMQAAFASVAAGMLGKIYLRGDGVEPDYARAWVWFSRGIELGDAESFNGLGVMYQNALGVARDMKKAVEFFEFSATAVPSPSAAGCMNLGKIYFHLREYTQAAKLFDTAVKLGNSFEAYYYLALINMRMGRFQLEEHNPHAYRVDAPGTASYERCRNAVSGLKLAVERADWKDPTFSRAERAWGKGLRGRALLGWSISGERGYEAAQNNIAWVLDRDKKRLRFKALDVQQSNATDQLALIHWIRSAAQDNVDALVKMGDYYYYGVGTGRSDQQQLFANEQNKDDDQTAKATSSPSASQVSAQTVSYEKAAACYSAAAERRTSALAYWNMGFMYERGLGVPKKDYNLAKRYYDMALDLHPNEAYLPVLLSLTKLFIMACWDAVTKKDATALNLLNGLAFGPTGRARVLNAMSGTFWDQDNNMPYTEADELRIVREREEMAAAAGADEQLGDPNLPETYGQFGAAAENHHDHRHGGDIGGGDGAGGGTENLDSTIEGLLIVFGLAALAMLVYVRQGVQLRLERQRREQAQAAAVANGDQAAQTEQQPQDREQQEPNAARGALGPAANPEQPFGWPLQDGNAYAGL